MQFIKKSKKSMSVLTSLLFLFFFQGIFADKAQTDQMVIAADSIKDLNQVIEDIKTKIQVPVVFPKYVPKSSQEYFAHSFFSNQKDSTDYWINVDSTKDCNGAKFCNVGYVKAEKNKPIEQFQDRDNKNITIPVALPNHKKAYFTPGHAMGDFFPPNIQWQEDNVLYTISWSNIKPSKNEKATLLNMAASAFPR